MRVREAMKEKNSRFVNGYKLLIVVLNQYHFIGAVKAIGSHVVAAMRLATGLVN
jgi:hypothetical protein